MGDVNTDDRGEDCGDEEMDKYYQFKRELRCLINKHSIENYSNTADYILAAYLVDCLKALSKLESIKTQHEQACCPGVDC